MTHELENSVRLPVWFRYTLVALATLMLCSCQALPPGVTAVLPIGVETQRTTAAPVKPAFDLAAKQAQSPGRAKAIEIRALNSEQVAAARPFNEQEVAAGYADPASYACDCCRGGGCATAGCGAGCGTSCSRGNCGPNGDCYGTTCPLPTNFVGPPDEYLCDGGDFGLPAAVRADWSVDGLEQEDAIAHYDTIDGRVVVTPSNRVCVYAPRFAAVRRVVNPLAHERRQLVDLAIEDTSPIDAVKAQPVVSSVQRNAVAINLGERPASLFRHREQATEVAQVIAPGEFYNTIGPYANLTVIRTGEIVGTEIVEVKRIVEAAVAWNGDQAAQVLFSNRQAVAVVGLKQPGVVYQTDEPGDPRLRLIKCASTRHALPGEEVEFTLRFDNIGDQVIGNVTIIDNLTTRLEYVPNTARSTLAADFSSAPNGAGSNIMRWEIKDPLKPGEGGVLQFKCRVR